MADATVLTLGGGGGGGEIVDGVYNVDNADLDLRIEGDTSNDVLFVDGGLERVGVLTDTPDEALHVVGTAKADAVSAGSGVGNDDGYGFDDIANWAAGVRYDISGTGSLQLNSQGEIVANIDTNDSGTSKFVVRAEPTPDYPGDGTSVDVFEVDEAGLVTIRGAGDTPAGALKIEPSGGASDFDAIMIGVGDEVVASIKLYDEQAESSQHYKISYAAGLASGFDGALKFRSDTHDDVLVLSANGKAALGHDTPLAALHIKNDIGAPTDLGEMDNYQIVIQGGGDTGDTAGILFSSTDDNSGGSAIVHYDTGGVGKGRLAFYTKQTTAVEPPIEVMSLGDDGTTTLAGNLVVQEIAGPTNLVLNADDAAGDLRFEINGTEEMRLTKQGAGTQAALVIGDVADTTFSADAKLVLRTAGDCGLHIVADTDNSGETDNPLIKMTQDGGDDATIGIAGLPGQIYTGSLGNATYIRSDYEGIVQIVTGSSVAMTIDDDDVTIVGDVSCVDLTETSDARLKEEVTDLDMGVDYINSLRPVSYKRKDDDSDKRHLGLIAQEVGPVTPDAALVHYNENTDEYSLAYTQLIAPLIKSVQELSARVKELETERNE